MAYKAPIRIFEKQITTQFENDVYKAVLKVGIEVDKDELFKALNYDRHQYMRGFLDGRKDIAQEIHKLLKRYEPGDAELHAALFMLAKLSGDDE